MISAVSAVMGRRRRSRAALWVVVDQVVLAVDDLEAADLEADDLTGTAAGIAQDLVDGLVHCLQVHGAHRAVSPRRAQQLSLIHI